LIEYSLLEEKSTRARALSWEGVLHIDSHGYGGKRMKFEMDLVCHHHACQ
jgi:hypothetical protein